MWMKGKPCSYKSVIPEQIQVPEDDGENGVRASIK